MSEMGICWNQSTGIPAERVVALYRASSFRRRGLLLGRTNRPDLKIEKPSGQEIVFLNDSRVQPLPVLADMQAITETTFGFKPEFVIRSVSGVGEFHSFQSFYSRLVRHLVGA